ncbi:ABC transporter ATP-binding protein [Thermoplasma sp.]|uniref:ABC transporter ATP-binding protein n=1 Tax=Thermoplasma sp. TaxID=1973142 RepID=UPI0012712814|nr:ABC transporter ATP-binding protein [Thermoplasma sp.]KAA8923107.1 MAG: ABC transporter ATP-binding protein [Thermoplasma sp.]
MMEISINAISKRYGDLVALDHVSFNVKGNGCIVLLGPNGAGKTTLMKIMTNIIRPSEGNVRINGINVRENPGKALEGVGSLIEQPEFYPYITGYEALMFTCMIRGISREKCVSEVERVSAMTHCRDYLSRRTKEYSRGMKQRVGLAAALIGDPEIIILDEPTFGLDPNGMMEIRDIIMKLKREKLIVLSTHLIYEAEMLADQIGIIDHGHLMHFGPVEKQRYLEVRGRISESPIHIDGVDIVRRDDSRLVIRKDDGIENWSIIKALEASGSSIETFDYYSIIEDLYRNNVSQNDAEM